MRVDIESRFGAAGRVAEGAVLQRHAECQAFDLLERAALAETSSTPGDAPYESVDHEETVTAGNGIGPDHPDERLGHSSCRSARRPDAIERQAEQFDRLRNRFLGPQGEPYLIRM